MRKKIIILLIFVFCISPIFAQTSVKPFYKLSYFNDSLMSINDYGGDVTVEENPQLEQLMTNFAIAYRNQHQKIWRIQIFFGSGRKGRIRAQNIKANFEAQHPGISTIMVFQEPYFKVRVGEFTNKLDAERLKAQLSDDYDKLFIVEDYER